MSEWMLTRNREQQRAAAAAAAAANSDQLNYTAFVDLCRLCAIKGGSRFCSLFDSREAEQRQLLFKIRTILPIVITKEDLLPKKVCERCVDQIEESFAWRTNCVQTEVILRNYAESMRFVTATINFQVSLSGRSNVHYN
uniref:Uncharacterized protein n=1 Tax=Anopheles atroparvus TaxID=41427 RepID=A0A182J296_ANOAO